MTATIGLPPVVVAPKAPRPKFRERLSPRQVWGNVIVYAVLIVIGILYIYPFLIEIFTSFKTEADATANAISLIPPTWTTAAYQQLFVNSAFPTWFGNSVIVTVFVTAGRVFFDSIAGYALARLRFRGRGVIFAGLIGVMAVPSVVLLIPKFLVLNTIGLYNSYPGMILPLLVDAAGVFIMKNFFESIPSSVEEQARIDGAGTFRTFWSIVLPMARPALVTIFILSFQGSWNELAQFIISTNDPNLTTLTKGVASLASGQLGAANRYPLKLGAALIMTVPVAVLFFIFQRKIMNTSDGAVKE
ncbi:MAG TPA: carbohydrate ABC transporter permease [Galbitalea sp.]|jgi:multiple sugar transport system permease protein|nr:carbohydrate ABC transporter permease [Galbitalea sp.]